MTAGKAVPSSAGGGPRDFSAAVHSNFAQAGCAVPDGGVHLEVHIYLGESEQGKIGPADLFEAITEMLARHGVDKAHCFHEAYTGPPPIPATSRAVNKGLASSAPCGPADHSAAVGGHFTGGSS